MSSTLTRNGHPPRSPAVIGLALLPAALVVVASLIAQVFSPPDEGASSTLAQCRAIAPAESRLACYDGIADQQSLPAKGGQAVIPVRP